MSARLTNLLLLGLVLAQIATGLLGWVVPEGRALPLYELHRGLGLALVLLLIWKQLVVRASLRRRLWRRPWDRSVLIGVASGVALLGSVGLGLAWTLDLVSFESFGGYSALNLHVALGLAVLPPMLIHLRRRWERKPAARELVTRRSALRLIGISGAALVSWRVLEQAVGFADAAGASALTTAGGLRRRSGSKPAASFSGNDFPTTIWLLDQVPALDAATWRLEISGQVGRPGSMSYQELLARPAREVQAVIDCTGGWWSEQVWRGVSIGDLLEARGLRLGATEATVISVTGHRWTFPLDELRSALLGTHVGGELLTPAHGYPVRLVAPGRRGFQWVKWVGKLEVG